MASFKIHLAIAKKYIEKHNNITNEKDFYLGSIAPDLPSDKAPLHFTTFTGTEDLIRSLLEKVDINKACQNIIPDTDYNKGILLHLITDYMFYTKFFDMDYVKSVSYSDYHRDLYYSYDITDEYIKNKYNLDLPFVDEVTNKKLSTFKKKTKYDSNTAKDIIPINKLEKFIEDISSIDLEDFKNKNK